MRKKRIMVIGPGRCGKTTLVNALNDYRGPLRRTPDMIYGENTIDVPGSYLENPWMYKHVIAAAQDASHVLLLIDQSSCHTTPYSHGFAKVFNCPVLGVIVKCDLSQENLEACFWQMEQAGVAKPYYQVSVTKGIGIEELKKYLLNDD